MANPRGGGAETVTSDEGGTGVGWALGIGRIGSIIGPALGGLMLAAHWPVAQLFFASAIPQFGAALLMAGIGVLPAWRRRGED